MGIFGKRKEKVQKVHIQQPKIQPIVGPLKTYGNTGNVPNVKSNQPSFFSFRKKTASTPFALLPVKKQNKIETQQALANEKTREKYGYNENKMHLAGETVFADSARQLIQTQKAFNAVRGREAGSKINPLTPEQLKEIRKQGIQFITPEQIKNFKKEELGFSKTKVPEGFSNTKVPEAVNKTILKKPKRKKINIGTGTGTNKIEIQESNAIRFKTQNPSLQISSENFIVVPDKGVSENSLTKLQRAALFEKLKIPIKTQQIIPQTIPTSTSTSTPIQNVSTINTVEEVVEEAVVAKAAVEKAAKAAAAKAAAEKAQTNPNIIKQPIINNKVLKLEEEIIPQQNINTLITKYKIVKKNYSPEEKEKYENIINYLKTNPSNNKIYQEYVQDLLKREGISSKSTESGTNVNTSRVVKSLITKAELDKQNNEKLASAAGGYRKLSKKQRKSHKYSQNKNKNKKTKQNKSKSKKTRKH